MSEEREARASAVQVDFNAQSRNCLVVLTGAGSKPLWQFSEKLTSRSDSAPAKSIAKDLRTKGIMAMRRRHKKGSNKKLNFSWSFADSRQRKDLCCTSSDDSDAPPPNSTVHTRSQARHDLLGLD